MEICCGTHHVPSGGARPRDAQGQCPISPIQGRKGYNLARENSVKYEYMHPREQLVTIMRRVYGYGMTTTSGGNISIRDESGDIWITPGARTRAR